MPLAVAGAVSLVTDSAEGLAERAPEEAEKRTRRALSLTGAEEPAEFTAKYVVDRTFPLPLAPAGVDYSKIPATALRFTQSGTSIQRSTTRRVEIGLTGESGTRYRLGFDRDGIPMFQPGHELHREFIAFLDDFLDGPDKGEDYRLTWHDFQTGRQFWVEPTQIADGLDAAHPIGPKWSLSLTGYHKSGYPNAGLGFALSILPQVRDQLRVADRWANSVAAAAALASVAMEGVTETLHGLGDVLDAIPRAIEASAAILDDAQAVERFPFEFWADLSERTEAAVDRFNQELGEFGDLSDKRGADFIERRAALRELQRALDLAAFAQKTQSAHSPESTPQTVYTIRAGDTLQDVAARFLGDSGRWYDVAVLNGLISPFVSLSGLPGTVGPGDKIVLPADASVDGEVQGADLADAERELYGIDFAIDRNGRMPVEPGRYPADVQLVSGVECVRQGLRITFGTVQGEDVFQPWFGVPDAIGDPSYSAAGLVLAQLVDQVLIDDRIAAVRRETIREIPNGLDVSFDIHLRTGRRLTGITSTVGSAAA